MEIGKLIFISQLTLGSLVTCLSAYTFINMNTLTTLSIQSQLNMLWILVSLGLLIYGLIQLSHGLIEMIEVSKAIKESMND